MRNTLRFLPVFFLATHSLAHANECDARRPELVVTATDEALEYYRREIAVRFHSEMKPLFKKAGYLLEQGHIQFEPSLSEDGAGIELSNLEVAIGNETWSYRISPWVSRWDAQKVNGQWNCYGQLSLKNVPLDYTITERLMTDPTGDPIGIRCSVHTGGRSLGDHEDQSYCGKQYFYYGFEVRHAESGKLMATLPVNAYIASIDL